MTAERTVIDPTKNVQMYVIFLKDGVNQNVVRAKLNELGGQAFQYLPKHAILLAQLKVEYAEILKKTEGIKHLGAVSLNSRLRKLKVKTDSEGNPLWDYKIDDYNNIYMVRNK